MKSYVLIGALLGLLCLVQPISAQNANTENQSQPQPEEKISRFEIGGHYTSLQSPGSRSGFGGRVSVNLTRNLAIESELNLFPQASFNGTAAQGLFGVKAGKRWNKFGIFAKARPGFFYNSRGKFVVTGNNVNNYRFDFKGTTDLTADLGGVLEFYPTGKIVTRFDFGDTITRFKARDAFFLDQNGNLNSFRIPARTQHSFQFSAGIGFRF